jgi:hypothetical protein
MEEVQVRYVMSRSREEKMLMIRVEDSDHSIRFQFRAPEAANCGFRTFASQLVPAYASPRFNRT